ncbi:hypothetical protein PACTADRAFT_76429 [Pachysolen tannophilus NRRL Y-2460]|uniref:Succinate dehydrogenase [ubiquinone] cytochrome b small subunit n=1 Tax=Pachysolen tannophilus NRRL Y-2460 TaxID=669874 RepID=A0A1E4TSS8_PACTA|nr:hypothetical protein PACTADRAFT_76429 [Pachysolen tannophilus NRRL Y-2460]
MFKSVGVSGICQRSLSLKSLSFRPFLDSFKLIPQPAGHVVGSLNDPFVPPAADHVHGSYHWTYDRLMTVAMIPLSMTPFISGIAHPIIDAGLCSLLLLHCKAGFESCIVDYIPKRVYGIWHNIAMRLLQLGSWISLYGIYVLETESNGMFEFISSIWGA